MAVESNRISASDIKESNVLNVRSRIAQQRTQLTCIVEWIGRLLSNPYLILSYLALNVFWIILNISLFAKSPFDPYPFVLLATITSAVAPGLALLILVAQHRDERIQELREEIGLQIALHAEREISITIRLLREILESMGVRSRQNPNTLQAMSRELDVEAVFQNVKKQLEESEGRDPGVFP